MNGITRREFLKSVAAGVAGMTLLKHVGFDPASGAEEGKSALPSSAVVIARTAKTRAKAAMLDRETARALLEKSVLALTKEKSARDAWARLLQPTEGHASPKPSDVVGLKLSCIGGPNLCTSRELVRAVIENLKAIGIAENNIIIWDRRDDELKNCGFELNGSKTGVRCYGTLPTRGYSEEVKTVAGKKIKLSAILENEISLLINMPILKDHTTCGMTAAMKNHYGSFNIPWKFHGNTGDPYVAEINRLAAIREKTRLIICDAFRPLCQGGPRDHPRYRWNYGGLLVGADPVALDFTGWQIIEEQRKAMGLRSLAEDGREPKYILTAEKLQLGSATSSKIRTTTVFV